MTHPEPVDEPLAYRLPKAADLLGVSLSTMKRLVASGRVRAVHPSPGVTLIPRAELLSLLSIPTDARSQEAL